MTGYVWADDPERHLADWADHPHHIVTYHQAPDGWYCRAEDQAAHVTIEGGGYARADAAYACLCRLAVHALEQARAQQQTP